MKFTENRKIAWIVLALCVLFSVVVLGGSGMARERGKIMDVFYEGYHKDDASHCMDAYLDRAFESARLMAYEAKLHLGDNNRSANEILDCLARVPAYEDAQDIYGLYSEWKVIAYQNADQLYNEMYAAQLTDAQRKNFKAAYDDFWECERFIQMDPYREMAADFTKEVEGNFPANLVCKVFGVDRLCSFGA